MSWIGLEGTMDQKLFRAQKGILNLVATIVGLGLLAILAFSFNALFASRSQQQSQTADQPEPSTTEKQSMPSPTIISLTPLPTPKNIEEWKGTSLGKVGFTFKYPPDWVEEPLKSTKGWLYRPENVSTYNYSVTYLAAQPVDDLKAEVVERLTNTGSFEIIKKQWVLVAGSPSFWITTRLGNSVGSEVRIPNVPYGGRKRVWVFNTKYRGPNAQNLTADPYEDTIRLILSTFQTNGK